MSSRACWPTRRGRTQDAGGRTRTWPRPEQPAPRCAGPYSRGVAGASRPLAATAPGHRGRSLARQVAPAVSCVRPAGRQWDSSVTAFGPGRLAARSASRRLEAPVRPGLAGVGRRGPGGRGPASARRWPSRDVRRSGSGRRTGRSGGGRYRAGHRPARSGARCASSPRRRSVRGATSRSTGRIGGPDAGVIRSCGTGS
jgi:hypothetical protein